MKRLFTTFFAMLVSVSVQAGRTVYHQNLVSEPGLAYSKTYDLDVNALNLDTLAAQAVYSQATFSASSWTDGQVSTETVTIKSASNLLGVFATTTITVSTNAALSKAAASNTINVASNSGLAGKTITINGAVLRNPDDWTILDVATNTLTTIVSAIARQLGGYTTSVVGSTITITLNEAGSFGNAYTLATSTPSALVVGGATFSGGRDAAKIALNGLIRTANIDWTVADVSSNTAINIKNMINADSSFSSLTASTSAATVVTLTCNTRGDACDSYPLTSSIPTALGVGAATFSGMVRPLYLTINGVTLTNGVDFTSVATTSGTASAIATAINANGSLSPIIVSTWAASVVYATSTAIGANTNYAWFSSNSSSVTVSSQQMRGGSDSAYAINTGNILALGHGLTTALPVLYSTGSNFALAPLVNQTTYYAIPVDASTFQLATTSTGAVAGNAIVLTSSSTAGAHTFTVTPLAFTGTWAFNWQSSNDGVNFFNLPNIATVTFSAAGTTMWDGPINFSKLRFNFTAGTAGAMNIAVICNGKKMFEP